jgi:hypothetical protein
VPVLSRPAPAATPLAAPLVAVAPRPEHRASSQSTSTVATLSVSMSSADPSTSDSETARQPPPATEHSAPAFVAAPGAVVPAVTAPVGPASWSASVELAAEPVQPVPQSTSAWARTSPASSSSTELDVAQSPPWHRADPLPAPPVLSNSSRSKASSSPALARRASAARSSRLLPELWLSHEPLELSHSADASSGVAADRCSHSPVQRADARVASPSPLRLDALLSQPPDASHDADDSLSPDPDDTPHPETPDSATHRSESRSPSASSLAAPHPTNTPLDAQPATEPSPSRSSSDTPSRSCPVASINSSVAS